MSPALGMTFLCCCNGLIKRHCSEHSKTLTDGSESNDQVSLSRAAQGKDLCFQNSRQDYLKEGNLKAAGRDTSAWSRPMKLQHSGRNSIAAFFLLASCRYRI